MPTFHFVELVLSLDYFSSLDSAAYAASSDGDADNDLFSLPGGFEKSFLSKPVWGTEHEQKVKKTPGNQLFLVPGTSQILFRFMACHNDSIGL